MLPSSLLSASTLKSSRDKRSQGHSTSMGASSSRISQQQHQQQALANTRPHEDEDGINQLDSEISSDSEEEDDSFQKTGLPDNLPDLTRKLQNQQRKMAKYLEKQILLNLSIQETSDKIARITGVSLAPQSSSITRPPKRSISTTSIFPPAKRSIPAVGIQRADTEHADRKRENNTSVANTPVPKQTARRAGAGLPLGSQQRPIIVSESSSSGKSEASSRSTRSNLSASRAADELSDEYSASGHGLKYSDTVEVYLTRKQDNLGAVFAKKPRNIMASVLDDGSDLANTLVATSMDGFQFWNTNTKRIVQAYSGAKIWGEEDARLEDAIWITPNTLALLPYCSRSAAPDEGPSLMLAHIDHINTAGATVRFQSLHKNPHVANIGTICPVQFGGKGGTGIERVSMVTGGDDKQIYLWDLFRDRNSGNFTLSNTTKLDIAHTNYVQAIRYDSNRDLLYTGGADNRMFIYDMATQTLQAQSKYLRRINHIIRSPSNPNLNMVVFADTKEQMHIYDSRLQNSWEHAVLRLGYQEPENLSRYVQPDWHQDGYMIACGCSSDVKTLFWDIRYRKVETEPPFHIRMPGEKAGKILRSLFVPNKRCIATISSTRVLTWTDFDVQSETRVL